jgi:hypothetical protein
MHARHIVPFLLLFAWQAAPTADPRDRPARLLVWLGGGESSFDYQWWGTDCDGNREIESGTDVHQSTGVRVDGWPSPTVRVSTAIGQAGSGSSSSRSAVGAGLLAWEGLGAGVGLGWAAGAASVGYDGPAAYVRVGPLDGVHFRADLRAPTATPGVTGWVRAGLGYNLGRRHGASVFLGVSGVKAGTDEVAEGPDAEPPTMDRLAVFADVTFGLGRNVDLFAQGHISQAATQARGFALGALIRLAR